MSASGMPPPGEVEFSFDDEAHCESLWDDYQGTMSTELGALFATYSLSSGSLQDLYAIQVGQVLATIVEAKDVDEALLDEARDLLTSIRSRHDACSCASDAYEIFGEREFSDFLATFPDAFWGVAREDVRWSSFDDLNTPVELSEIFNPASSRETWDRAHLSWDGSVLKATFGGYSLGGTFTLVLTPLPMELNNVYAEWQESTHDDQLVAEVMDRDQGLLLGLSTYLASDRNHEYDPSVEVPSYHEVLCDLESLLAGLPGETVEVVVGLLPNWEGSLPELVESAGRLTS